MITITRMEPIDKGLVFEYRCSSEYELLMTVKPLTTSMPLIQKKLDKSETGVTVSNLTNNLDYFVSLTLVDNSGRIKEPLARVQAVYAKRLDNCISHLYWGYTPVLNAPTPGVAVMGLIHPTKKRNSRKLFNSSGVPIHPYYYSDFIRNFQLVRIVQTKYSTYFRIFYRVSSYYKANVK